MSVPRASGAEWEVLRVLWEREEVLGSVVVSILQQTTHWKPTTIRTLLSRLVKKRVIGFRPVGSGYLYFPLMTQAECEAAERRTFLQKVYGGNARSMIAAFLTEERLTPEDLDALQQLLDDRRSP
jgi:BlaI family penicillinase repressor